MAIETAQLGLDKVRLRKDALLEKLRSNLEKHRTEYTEALEGWKTAVIAEMEHNLDLARSAAEYKLHVRLERPEDYSADYAQVINLLEASVDEIIILRTVEFQQYHENNWAWSARHQDAVSNYSSRR